MAAAKEGRLDLFAADVLEAVNKLAARYGKDDRAQASTIQVLMEFPAVTIAEPGFPASLPPDRLCRVRPFIFGEPSAVRDGQELKFSALLDDPAVYAVSVEVKPSATAEEIRTMYPRPKAKAAKKAAKRRKRRA